ncbi:HD domain-containing protein [candidate division KSB1 bacterium]|nr:HD domain-containing protein [candidate division KSB1 bacterium]RQW11047.1 MAG: HD domain-containing protein [candidate division KSB1 bacterium]
MSDLRHIRKPSFRTVLFETIGRVADEMGVQVYVVGGYVRDRFLHRPNAQDIDFVVTGDGPAFAKGVAQRLGARKVTIYRRFGTAHIRHRRHSLEFVGARKENYRGDSRKPAVEGASLLDDLARRDFTINAMAVALNPDNFGALIDPYDGRDDVAAGIIRTPLDPHKTFNDDPLRIMRAIRFSCQLQFRIEPATRAGLAAEAHRLSIISQERITDELMKILQCPRPSIGFQIMDETGVLEKILPECAKLKGVDYIGNHRHKDVFHHTLKVLDNCAAVSDKLELRIAALFHDIAKPATKAYDPVIGWTFHGHEEIGARMFQAIGRRLRLASDTIEYVTKLIRLHLRPIHLSEEGVTDSAIRRLIFSAGDEIDDLLTLCRADITSGNPQRVKKHLANFDHVERRVAEVEEKDRLRNFQPPLRGEEIMRTLHLLPGPLVGKVKKAIEEAILNGDIANEHDAAFDYMMQRKDELLAHPVTVKSPAE